MSATISFPYTVTIKITAPDVTQILLNGSTAPIAITLSAQNAGAVIAAVTVVTSSGNPWTTPLKLEGNDATKFALSHGGVVPCNLIVSSNPIPAAEYHIILSAPPAGII